MTIRFLRSLRMTRMTMEEFPCRAEGAKTVEKVVKPLGLTLGFWVRDFSLGDAICAWAN
jgi:hypothetical protein